MVRRLKQGLYRIGSINLWMAIAASAIAALMLLAASKAEGQTYTLLHNFSGPDGAAPYGTLTMDRAGNLYGTTYFGGNGCGGYGCGTVFKLTHKNSGWILARLYSFQGGNDGEYPLAGVTIGPDGSLYGTTSAGGGNPPICTSPVGGPGCGTIFKLQPPATACTTALCPWTETVLYRFMGGSDGAYPGYGNLVFDQTGNLYGTTEGDEFSNQATAFKLSRSGSGWTKSLVYNFGYIFVGSGMIFDHAGNLYGTTADSGGWGTVYELIPSGSGWTETTLYQFQNDGDGYEPLGGVAFDQAGNLYGTTFNDGGRVYELSPSAGGWIYSSLYYFNSYEGSYSGPTVDAVGNVYGVMSIQSLVFKLAFSNGGWSETDLTDFGGDPIPVGGVILDGNGNIYGTTSMGGTGSCRGVPCGDIFEITPN